MSRTRGPLHTYLAARQQQRGGALRKVVTLKKLNSTVVAELKSSGVRQTVTMDGLTVAQSQEFATDLFRNGVGISPLTAAFALVLMEGAPFAVDNYATNITQQAGDATLRLYRAGLGGLIVLEVKQGDRRTDFTYVRKGAERGLYRGRERVTADALPPRLQEYFRHAEAVMPRQF